MINVAEQRVTPTVVRNQERAANKTPRADNALVLPGIAAVLFDSRLAFSPTGREDLRLFVNDIEVDVTTNYDLRTLSNNTAREIETVGLAIERALGDAPPAGSHV